MPGRSETSVLRPKVLKALKSLHAVPIENGGISPGTPDVNYAGGWIELKQIERWPAKEDEPVKVSHFEPQQRLWALERRMAGGTVWFLLQAGTDYILLDGAVAAIRIGTFTRKELFTVARGRWTSFNDEELLSCVQQRQSGYYSRAEERAKLKRMLLQTMRSL